MTKLKEYRISADGGHTWTEQWLTEDEAREQQAAGYTVEKLDPR